MRASEVRADFVPVDHYISPEFLKLEKERLWPRVWHMACREEELPRVGSYVVYDMMGESIIVVRASQTQIKAFYNVCQHRGRRLMDGCGQTARFHCKFHSWQWNIDGSIARVLDREDWAGCSNFEDKDLHLPELAVDTWGGWVFINANPNPEPLREFLDPVAGILDPFEIEKMRYRWYISVKVPCNWKVGMEAFNEAYHVAGTHPQLLAGQGDDGTRTYVYGKHAKFTNLPEPKAPFGAPSPRTGQPIPDDLRKGIIGYLDLINTTLKAIYSERDVEASRRLLTEVDQNAPPEVMMGKLLEFQREAAIACGAGWPDITPMQLFEGLVDWHIFPNLIILPYPDAAIAYRTRPDPTDPDVCIFDVYSLQRYAPGAEPPLERKIHHGDGDWVEVGKMSEILGQDFANMSHVQQGMHSRGFKGARTNPLQESTVSNFHKIICEYLEMPPA